MSVEIMPSAINVARVCSHVILQNDICQDVIFIFNKIFRINFQKAPVASILNWFSQTGCHFKAENLLFPNIYKSWWFVCANHVNLCESVWILIQILIHMIHTCKSSAPRYLWLLGKYGSHVSVASGYLWLLGKCGFWVNVVPGYLWLLGKCGSWVLVAPR